MRALLCFCLILLTAGSLSAETYSWMDGEGVWNFSDDFNNIPKKYRKGVKRSADDDSTPIQQKMPLSDKSEIPASKAVTVADADKRLYDGKTQDAWRKEFNLQEAELIRLEQRFEELQGSLNARPDQLSRERRSELLREYEAARVEYKDKYKHYSDLIESARKAGLTVEIKK